MVRGIEIRYLYHDNDVIQLQIVADNGRFRGTTRVYAGIGELSDIAESLRGFPEDPYDKRQVMFGQFGRKIAGGAVRLRLYCRDMAGHPVIEVKIEAAYAASYVAETMTALIDFEPAALDVFLQELPKLEKQFSGCAALTTH
jgi:hypothetical protein